MVLLFCSDSIDMPVGSGLAQLTKHLPAYILDSALELNPSLTRSSEVITHFSTIHVIKRFIFFLISPIYIMVTLNFLTKY